MKQSAAVSASDTEVDKKMNDCNIVTLLAVYKSVTVVQIEGMNYGSDQRVFERFVPLVSDSISVRECFISQFSV